MVLLLQIGDQIVPEQTPEVVLHPRGGPVSSIRPCSSALCTMTHKAQVGQEGIGKSDKVQVCNCGLIGAILVLAQPQQLLTVFEKEFHGPAVFVRLDQPSRRQLWGIGHQPKDLPDGSCAREDHMQRPKGTDLEPARIDKAVTNTTLEFRQDQGCGAAPPKHLLTVAPRLEFPAGLEQAAIPFEGGGKAKALCTTSLHDSMAEIIGIKHYHH